MDSCKLITRLVSAGMDSDLSAGERLRVRLHLLFCRNCANVKHQLETIRTSMRRLASAPARHD